MNKANILIIEGPLSRGLVECVTTNGLKIVRPGNLQDAVSKVGEGTHLIVLDMLATGVTWEAWQALQKAYQGRILLISPTLGEMNGEIVTAPVDLQHLVQRIRKLLGDVSLTICVSELNINLATRQVAVRGNKVRLTCKEFELLAYLAQGQGRVISYDELLEAVWSYPPEQGNYNLVRSCMKRLRRKLGEDPRQPQYLINVRGVG